MSEIKLTNNMDKLHPDVEPSYKH